MFQIKKPLITACFLSISLVAVGETSHKLEKIVVTSTKESKSISDLSESVGVLSHEDIKSVSPSHPSEILNRTAGVYVNNLGGEGHMTAIRQPITTGGVYLFLEDGIPTRPTGFFNHNGLYEVNIPQSDRLEVTKGPGSALYGSDAIGGVINSISANVPETKEQSLNAEVGSYEWQRVLLSMGSPFTHNTGGVLTANFTENTGFRDDADYSRASLNSRILHKFSNGTQANLAVSYSEIDQSGVSGLEFDDYKNNIEKNEYAGDVGSRDIEALRMSAVISTELTSGQLLTMTPFYRNNTSSMMPSWMVSYDPNVRETEFESFGLLSKWRVKQTRSEIVTGLDIDHTPSSYLEEQVTVTAEDDIYTDYDKTGIVSYDYDATQTSVSPYAQFEYRISQQFITNIGVRYDYFEVDYTNNLSSPVDSRHLSPESQTLEYDHVSPKAGVVFNMSPLHDVYFNYRHGFRAPSVSQLFRAGSSAGTTELKPIKTDSFEIGFRGLMANAFSYEIALYHMEKSDDIVSIVNSDDDRQSVNAGETIHQGIELSLSGPITTEITFNSSFSYSNQEYGDFTYTYFCFSCSPNNQVVNFDGNQVGKAPKTLGNLAISYQPLSLQGFTLEAELEHVGAYYTDETNTQDYQGHQLLNIRSQYQLSKALEFYLRVQNLMDKRYSTYTSNQVGSDEISYRPGAPMSLYAGIRANF